MSSSLLVNSFFHTREIPSHFRTISVEHEDAEDAQVDGRETGSLGATTRLMTDCMGLMRGRAGRTGPSVIAGEFVPAGTRAKGRDHPGAGTASDRNAKKKKKESKNNESILALGKQRASSLVDVNVMQSSTAGFDRIDSCGR